MVLTKTRKKKGDPTHEKAHRPLHPLRPCSARQCRLQIDRQLSKLTHLKLFFIYKETPPMKKLTVRYIRYALALLANVGFGLSFN